MKKEWVAIISNGVFQKEEIVSYNEDWTPNIERAKKFIQSRINNSWKIVAIGLYVNGTLKG
jgi:hypothetical protein